MLIEATKLIGLPIAAEDTMSKVGAVSGIVVDPENGQLLGLIISNGIFLPKKALSAFDIKFWDPAGIITLYENNLVAPTEIVRIQNVLERKIELLGMLARTESGKSLGHVEDFVIETETQSVVKYYLKDLLKKRVMGSDKVVSIDKEIVFTDDAAVETEVIKSEAVAPLTEAQTA